MARLLLNTLALDPNRWTPHKLPYYRLETLVSPMAEAGFQHVELWQYHIAHEAERTVQQLWNRAAALGMCFSVVGLYPRLHLEGAARRDAWDAAQRMLDYAGVLRAEVVKIFVGTQGTGALDEAAYQRSLAFLADLVEQAQARGLIITGETHPDTLFDAPEACLKVLGAVNSPHFKVCFQPFGFADTVQALADYEALAEHVIHVHYQGRRAGALTRLADADLDYRAFTCALAARGFDGYLCIELVEDSIVPDPAHFDLSRVLTHAQRDRDFVVQAARRCGMTLEA